MIIGNIFIYIPALIWLSIYDFGWPENGKLFSQAVYPFLIGDFIKLILASLSINILWKLSKKNNFWGFGSDKEERDFKLTTPLRANRKYEDFEGFSKFCIGFLQRTIKSLAQRVFLV